MKELLKKYLDKQIIIKGFDSDTLEKGKLFIVADNYCGIKGEIKSGKINYYIPYSSISSITERIRINQRIKEEILFISMNNSPFKPKHP